MARRRHLPLSAPTTTTTITHPLACNCETGWILFFYLRQRTTTSHVGSSSSSASVCTHHNDDDNPPPRLQLRDGVDHDYNSRKPSLYPSGTSSQAIPAKRSALDAVESSKLAKQPAQKKPAPKKKAAPVPASSQKNPLAKPRKPVKSAEYVHSTDEYEEDNAKVAGTASFVQGEVGRPKERALDDFEGYCGMFFFFYRKKK